MKYGRTKHSPGADILYNSPGQRNTKPHKVFSDLHVWSMMVNRMGGTMDGYEKKISLCQR